MKIAVYMEDCILAGKRAWEHERRDDWDSDIIVVFVGDASEFEAYARTYEQKAREHKPGRSYEWQVADTLREAIWAGSR